MLGKIGWAPTIVINGVITSMTYEWPKINGFHWVYNPTYRGPITPFITIVGTHLEGINDFKLNILGLTPKSWILQLSVLWWLGVFAFGKIFGFLGFETVFFY